MSEGWPGSVVVSPRAVCVAVLFSIVSLGGCAFGSAHKASFPAPRAETFDAARAVFAEDPFRVPLIRVDFQGGVVETAWKERPARSQSDFPSQRVRYRLTIDPDGTHWTRVSVRAWREVLSRGGGAWIGASSAAVKQDVTLLLTHIGRQLRIRSARERAARDRTETSNRKDGTDALRE